MNKLFFFVSLSLLLSISFASHARDIVIDSPWVREAPPNEKALAGYVTLVNVGKTARELVDVSSPMFDRVEFHVTTFEGGMMRMKHLKKLVLAPKESVEFEPGGRHLMLINPKKRLKAGDVVPMMFILKSGKQLSFDMLVRR